jgi:glycogen debranching enzyme
MDAYINAYFYASLLAMAEIEEFVGEHETARQYRQLAVRTRERFNETFRDEEKGRFIGCIDVEGNRWDLGFISV